MLEEIKTALDLYHDARQKADAAKVAYNAAHDHYISAIPANWIERRAENIRAQLAALQAEYNAAHDAHERAERIANAAAYIARRRIEAAAAPVVLATLKKYAGKPAGPKTRDKAAAEIAAALGVRSVYFSGHWDDECHIQPGAYIYNIQPRVESRYPARMIDAENRFCVPEELNTPDLDKLPADLEAWADEFETAAAELEAAREAFEAAASKARRVNLGPVRLKDYHITDR